MSLRSKTIIVVGLTTFSLIAILFASSQGILLSGIFRLEVKDVQKKVELVLNSINENLAQMDKISLDYTDWDQTVSYINDEKINKGNFNNAVTMLGQLNLNFILFVDNSGNILFTKSITLVDNHETQLPPDLSKYFSPGGLLLSGTIPQGATKGALALLDGPILILSRPILNSQDQDRIQGYVILGRFLDGGSSNFVGLANVTFKNLSLKDTDVPFEALQMSFAPPGSATGIVSQPLNKDSIAGYTLLRDISGNPAVVIRVEQDRDLYKQGQLNISYFGLALLAAGLAYAVILLYVLENYVLTRLAHLGKSVSLIGKSNNIAARVVLPGNDELGQLAREINKMLEILNSSENALRQSEERLKLAISGADLLLWDLNLETHEIIFNRDVIHTTSWVDKISNSNDLPNNLDVWRQIILQQDLPAIEKAFRQHLNGQIPQFVGEHRILTHSGDYLWVQLTGKIIFNEKGKPFRMVGVSQNINQRKGIEETKHPRQES